MSKPVHFGKPFFWICAVAVSLVLILGIEFGLSDLDLPARRALMIFVLAVVGWVAPIDNTFVAVTAAIAMALFVVGSPNDLFQALGDNIIWLLVAAFIFAAAFRASGLDELLVSRAAKRAKSVRGMFYALTGVMVASAFVIPATSGRAATMLPVFSAVTAGTTPRIRVAFALLIPTVVLLSAFGSLIGAGAHIAALEILTRMAGQQLSFAYWALLCLPFAVLSVVIAVELILRLFLTPEERATHVTPMESEKQPEKIRNQPIVWVMLAVLLGWFTAPWHGVDETLIAVLGALFVTMPHFGALSFKEALKQVDWNLLVFLAATNSLAQAMVKTGLGDQLLHGVFGDINESDLSPLGVTVVVALAGMLLHLIVHSRTARVAVLLPPVLLLAQEANLNPVTMMLVTVAATGLCQTLTVSAKPVILYSQIEGPTYSQMDLLRLSVLLFPVHLGLIILFVSLVWPWLGIPLSLGAG